MNKIISNLMLNPETCLQNMKEKKIIELLEYLSDKYFNDEPVVSDKLYDFINSYYENTYGKKLVSGAMPIKNKVVLPFFMGSLNKIKPSTTDFNNWMTKYLGPYIISYKLDGISALIYKKNDNVYMCTKGDGNIGEDVSKIVNHINVNTELLKNGDAIRGELIMSKANFESIKKTGNIRSIVGGIVRKKTMDKPLLKLIDFVPYWCLSCNDKMSEQLKYIDTKDFNAKTITYFKKSKLTIEYLSELLCDARKTYKYEIDGLVVIDDSKIYPLNVDTNPDYGFAFKQILTDQIAETVVLDVIWSISKDMYLKPKIKIETVEIGGSVINYATAFNAKYIYDNNIGPGTTIKIIKSGDVIPYILEILSTSYLEKPKMPDIEYTWNESGVDIIGQDLDETNNDILIVKKLAYFFDTIGTNYMGEPTITKFVKNGYNDLYKILLADKNKIDIPGLKEKSIEKIYNSIDESINNMKLYQLMAGSLLFGRGIGIRKLKLITDTYPNIIDIWKENDEEHVYDLLIVIPGFEKLTVNKILYGFNDFIKYHKKFVKIRPDFMKTSTLKKEDKIYPLKKPSDLIMTGNKFVFSGFRDNDMKTTIEGLGGIVVDSVSKNTYCVIVKDVTDVSSKITKAKELNIKIITKNNFLDKI